MSIFVSSFCSKLTASPLFDNSPYKRLAAFSALSFGNLPFLEKIIPIPNGSFRVIANGHELDGLFVNSSSFAIRQPPIEKAYIKFNTVNLASLSFSHLKSTIMPGIVSRLVAKLKSLTLILFVSSICFCSSAVSNRASAASLFNAAASLSALAESGISQASPSITIAQQITPKVSTDDSCFSYQCLKNFFERISNPSPNTPRSTNVMAGCLVENSQQYPSNENNESKRHMDEKVDFAAPYILRGALIVFVLLQFFRFFIKK